MMTRTYAVLTGDVIKSSRLAPEVRQQVMDYIVLTGKRLPKIFADLPVSGPEVFRGDSWQMLLSNARYCLHAAFYLRASLVCRFNADTRIGIGIGGLDALPSGSLGGADGQAFRRSGSALDQIKRGETMLCLLDDASDAAGGLVNASLRFAARLASEWSQLEAFAVAHSLEGKKQAEIAQIWIGGATSQQNAANALHRAGWNELEAFLTCFAEFIDAKFA